MRFLDSWKWALLILAVLLGIAGSIMVAIGANGWIIAAVAMAFIIILISLDNSGGGFA